MGSETALKILYNNSYLPKDISLLYKLK